MWTMKNNRGGQKTIFEPPPSRRMTIRTRWIRAGLAAVATAVAAVVAVALIAVVHHPVGPALCAPSPPPLQVFRNGRECVGTTDGTFPFDPGSTPADRGITRAEQDIAAENKKVVSQRHYVTVALLTPLTWSSKSLVTLARIQDELEGAYAAQYNANVRQGVYPPIRLVLANEGSQEQAWSPVVSQLKRLTAAPGQLVGVIGMGLSVTQTVAGAQALSAAGIPMIGSVFTADTLDWQHIPGLARVAPSNKQEVAALVSYLRAHGGLGKAFIVSDNETSDLYTASLEQDFQTAFGTQAIGPEPYGPGPGAGNEFSAIAGGICGPAGPPPLVIYAGREVVLGTFIQELQGTADCDGKKITILTGSDASAIDPGFTATQPGQAQVSVRYAALINSSAITPAFRSLFTGMFGGNDLQDSWMLETYDAMAAMSQAVSLATGSSTTYPTPGEIKSMLLNLNLVYEVQGATGPFSFDSDGNEVSPDLPIEQLANGSLSTLSR
jgi:ABC-type branched-subunit amino acid transport system substrate-binding protein